MILILASFIVDALNAGSYKINVDLPPIKRPKVLTPSLEYRASTHKACMYV
jgi:hypothetical protein